MTRRSGVRPEPVGTAPDRLSPGGVRCWLSSGTCWWAAGPGSSRWPAIRGSARPGCSASFANWPLALGYPCCGRGRPGRGAPSPTVSCSTCSDPTPSRPGWPSATGCSRQPGRGRSSSSTTCTGPTRPRSRCSRRCSGSRSRCSSPSRTARASYRPGSPSRPRSPGSSSTCRHCPVRRPRSCSARCRTRPATPCTTRAAATPATSPPSSTAAARIRPHGTIRGRRPSCARCPASSLRSTRRRCWPRGRRPCSVPRSTGRCWPAWPPSHRTGSPGRSASCAHAT